jgi:hydrogenase expression/formation protein HypC
MCLAVPMRIESIDGAVAVVNEAGIVRHVRVDFLPDLQPGDYVLVHAGVAIQHVSPEDAEAMLSLLRTLTDAEC